MAKVQVRAADGKIWRESTGAIVTGDICHAPCKCPCTIGEWATMAGGGDPCHGLVQEYRITGYSNGDLVADDHCDLCNGNCEHIWQGNFRANASYCGLWQPPTISGYEEYEIDGRELKITGTTTALMRPIGPPCASWLIWIICKDGDTPYAVWRGYKATGSTPAGEYLRIDGFDITASLWLEAA